MLLIQVGIIHLLHSWLLISYFFLFSTIIHEFVHALGAFHVHSRDDRDKYVSINWSNIQQSQQHNFKKHANAPTFGTPYDPLSIMHYEHWAFGIDKSKPTIYSKVWNLSFIYSESPKQQLHPLSNRCLTYQPTNLELLNNFEMLISFFSGRCTDVVRLYTLSHQF